MKAKTIFFCTECGNEFPKWQGRCPACGNWNTIVEQPSERVRGSAKTAVGGLHSRPQAKRLSEIEDSEELRFQTGMGELDHVLGGGAVQGSLVLIGGAPGIGKSTLMLQICDHLCQFATVLYVSGEESSRQIKLRADRLDIRCKDLYILAENNLEAILDAVEEVKPQILIVDSMQTILTNKSDSMPGSIAQVKQCTMALMELAKGEGVTVFVIGHINKEGSIAGPKVLEHMVDCVLTFEGEAGQGSGGSAQPVGNAPERTPHRHAGHLRDLRDGRGAAGAGGGPGAGGALRVCVASAHQQRGRLQPGHAAAGSAGKKRRIQRGRSRRLHQCHRRPEPGRTGGGLGHHPGGGVQHERPTGAGRAGGHRGSGLDRRVADGERSGSAVGRGASAGVHPVYAAGTEQSEAAGVAWAAADSREEHPRGAGLAAQRDLTARC